MAYPDDSYLKIFYKDPFRKIEKGKINLPKNISWEYIGDPRERMVCITMEYKYFLSNRDLADYLEIDLGQIRKVEQNNPDLEKEAKPKEKMEIQDWHLKCGDLLYASEKFSDQSDSKLAELCGYYIDSEEGREVLVEEYLAELKKCVEEQEETDKEFHLYNGQIVWEDHEHTGDVYVPKRCIIDDPDFYNISDWKEITEESLFEELYIYYSGEELKQKIKNELDKFGEPMMSQCICLLNYLDNQPVGDEGELKVFGVKPKDVHPDSNYMHG